MAKKQDTSKDEQIGFHKGALTTLAKEREEMIKILQIVEQLMQMHIKGLKELVFGFVRNALDAKNLLKQARKNQANLLRIF